MSERTNAVAQAIHAEICGCEAGKHAASYREAARAAIKAMRDMPPLPLPQPEHLSHYPSI